MPLQRSVSSTPSTRSSRPHLPTLIHHVPSAMMKMSYMRQAKVPFVKKRRSAVVSGVGLPRVIATVTGETPGTKRTGNKIS